MKRILVGIDSNTTTLLSVIYALNFAKRMDMKISILLVIEPASMSGKPEEAAQNESAIRKRLEKFILDGRSEGTTIDFFVAYGSFKEEVIKFIKEEKIGLLIVDSPFPDRKVASGKLPALFGEIKQRTHCRVEVVHKKDINSI